jgi:hypothetical protein
MGKEEIRRRKWDETKIAKRKCSEHRVTEYADQRMPVVSGCPRTMYWKYVSD